MASNLQNSTTAPTWSSFAVFNSYLGEIVALQAPRVAVLSIISNLLMVSVLTRKRMRHNPTNIILCASTLADLLTPLSSWPVKFYAYTFGLSGKHAVLFKCSRLVIILEYLSDVFHTASIWLTILLAGQRCICIRYSALDKKL